MATLENLEKMIDKLHADGDYKRLTERGYNILETGRYNNHEFIVRSNLRTLRSGPNRGKLRVNGVTVIMLGNPRTAKDSRATMYRTIRTSKKFRQALEHMRSELAVCYNQ